MRIDHNGLIRYQIQPYDTLGQIARKYNTNIYEIMDINRDIDFNNLYVGQNILVRMNSEQNISNNMVDYDTDIELMKQLRMLWEQHSIWTRSVIYSIVQNLPDVDFVTQRLLRNPKDFAALFQKFYGKQTAEKFDDLLTSHLVIAADLVKAAKAGETQKATEIEKKWYANADDIAAFLASINPNWSRLEWQRMMYQHLDLVKAEAVQLLTGKYAESIDTFDEIEKQALMMADVMQQGIEKQFLRY